MYKHLMLLLLQERMLLHEVLQLRRIEHMLLQQLLHVMQAGDGRRHHRWMTAYLSLCLCLTELHYKKNKEVDKYVYL